MTAPRHTGTASMCAGKVPFDSQALAAKAAGRPRRSDRPGMQPYRCAECHKWHIGAVKRAPHRPRLLAADLSLDGGLAR